jgi:DNA-binding NtrC family response regulator
MLSTGSTSSVATAPLADDAPRLLLACEDPVLLDAMQRTVSWMRPRWTVEAVQGPGALRRTLAQRAYDVLVCSVEPRDLCGREMLRHARVNHPEVVRVAYRTSDVCDGPELDHAHELVSWPANVAALIEALDRAVNRLRRNALRETETPSRASIRVV